MLYESDKGEFTFALTGETLLVRKLSVFREPQFLKLVEMLREADLTFSNVENIFQDWNDAPNTYAGGGAPGGTYLGTPPAYVAEYKWAGIDVVSTANNHGSDFGEAGVLSNLRFLAEGDLPQAGSGRNLTEATAPVYVDTPKGRVALLAACDWGPRGLGDLPWPFPMGVIAGEQSPYSKGRPGLNLIRHRSEVTVDRKSFDHLRAVIESLGWSEGRKERGKMSVGWDKPPMGIVMKEDEDDDSTLHFMGTKFSIGKEPGVRTVAEQADVDRNLKWVREARRMAQWVLVSFHNHGASPTPSTPPTHAVAFAHDCIDNGADMYIGHGTGRDRGIEIYKGKPIFYGLGHFVAQNDQVPMQPYELMSRFGLGHENTPADFYDMRSGNGAKGHHVDPDMWEGMVPIVRYEYGQLRSIQIHPYDLGMNSPRHARGRPMLAPPDSAVFKSVISRYQAMSAPFGTRITDSGQVVIE